MRRHPQGCATLATGALMVNMRSWNIFNGLLRAHFCPKIHSINPVGWRLELDFFQRDTRPTRRGARRPLGFFGIFRPDIQAGNKSGALLLTTFALTPGASTKGLPIRHAASAVRDGDKRKPAVCRFRSLTQPHSLRSAHIASRGRDAHISDEWCSQLRGTEFAVRFTRHLVRWHDARYGEQVESKCDKRESRYREAQTSRFYLELQAKAFNPDRLRDHARDFFRLSNGTHVTLQQRLLTIGAMLV